MEFQAAAVTAVPESSLREGEEEKEGKQNAGSEMFLFGNQRQQVWSSFP